MNKGKNNKSCFFCNSSLADGAMCEICEKELLEYISDNEENTISTI